MIRLPGRVVLARVAEVDRKNEHRRRAFARDRVPLSSLSAHSAASHRPRMRSTVSLTSAASRTSRMSPPIRVIDRICVLPLRRESMRPPTVRQ